MPLGHCLPGPSLLAARGRALSGCQGGAAWPCPRGVHCPFFLALSRYLLFSFLTLKSEEPQKGKNCAQPTTSDTRGPASLRHLTRPGLPGLAVGPSSPPCFARLLLSLSSGFPCLSRCAEGKLWAFKKHFITEHFKPMTCRL